MTQPAKPPQYEFEWDPSPATSRQSPVDFSPPLIAMVVVIGTAFLIITYFRLISRYLLPPLLRLLRRSHLRWRRWRHRRYPPSDIESPPHTDAFETAFPFFSHYGLDETAIKTIPLTLYNKGSKRRSISVDSAASAGRVCAVCLLEFEENEYLRTLPACSHAFHVDCIDIWLRSHASCPLCRAGIFRPESPFIPLMAARIRPSFDDGFLSTLRQEPDTGPVPEITPSVEISSTRIDERRDFLLKRSYSFGFERNLASDRMVLEPATTSPWRYRRGGTFWSKRPSPSPFSSAKSRVFSFRYYRNMKSPFHLRRRERPFFTLSESSNRFAGGGGGSSRRSKSLTSPIFIRSSAATAFSSSRLRCGDPEALLSPERLNRR
ncbi:RING/U-box superfamily protein [Tasmannia lanceolata]|uniref:RING/U-box superfamily protein n=1 Tax=Tasmannia lanceolata TaxID=3420 RepID=UPI004062B875